MPCWALLPLACSAFHSGDYFKRCSTQIVSALTGERPCAGPGFLSSAAVNAALAVSAVALLLGLSSGAGMARAPPRTGPPTSYRPRSGDGWWAQSD